jgi:hypothetical protein
MRSILRDDRGISLVVALIMMTIILMLTAGSLLISGIDSRATSNLKTGTTAYYVAEVGIQRALKELNNGATPSTGGTLTGGEYTVAVTDITSPIAGKQVVATGYVPNQTNAVATRAIVLFAKPNPSTSVFQWGAYGKTSVSLGGSGSLADSYNSSVAAYNAATANSHGNLRSNGSMTFNPATVVKGDATAGGTVTGGTVTGTITQNAPAVADFSLLTCPGGGYTPASAVPSGSHITYDESTGKLVVGSGGSLTLSALTKYYFSEITLSGGGLLTVNSAGQHVDMYVAGDFKAGGGGLVNTDAKPTNLTVSACGTSTGHSWTVNGGSGAYFGMYAPDRDVVIGGGGDLWGSVIGLSVSATGGSKIHFDEAFAGGGGGTNQYSVVGWKDSSF